MFVRSSVAKGFAGLERVRYTLLSFALAAQADEGLALEIEDVLLCSGLWRGDPATGHDPRKLAGDKGIVFTGVFASDQHMYRELRSREELFAEDTNVSRWRRTISGADQRKRRLFCARDLPIAVHGNQEGIPAFARWAATRAPIVPAPSTAAFSMRRSVKGSWLGAMVTKAVPDGQPERQASSPEEG